MRYFWNALPVSGLVLFSACCNPAPSDSAEQVEAPEFSVLANGDSGSLAEGTVVTARSQEQFKALWKQLNVHRQPAAALPDAEWSWDELMVVGVVLGERPTAGYGVAITGLTPEGEGWLVHATETRPAPGSVQPTVITNPFQLIVTTSRPGSVRVEFD